MGTDTTDYDTTLVYNINPSLLVDNAAVTMGDLAKRMLIGRTLFRHHEVERFIARFFPLLTAFFQDDATETAKLPDPIKKYFDDQNARNAEQQDERTDMRLFSEFVDRISATAVSAGKEYAELLDDLKIQFELEFEKLPRSAKKKKKGGMTEEEMADPTKDFTEKALFHEFGIAIGLFSDSSSSSRLINPKMATIRILQTKRRWSLSRSVFPPKHSRTFFKLHKNLKTGIERCKKSIDELTALAHDRNIAVERASTLADVLHQMDTWMLANKTFKTEIVDMLRGYLTSGPSEFGTEHRNVILMGAAGTGKTTSAKVPTSSQFFSTLC